MTFTQLATPRYNLTAYEKVKEVVVLFWTALWLYLSLGMVVASFSAIQFQTSVSDDAAKRVQIRSGNTDAEGASTAITVSRIQLGQLHYQSDLKKIDDLSKEVDRATSATQAATNSSSDTITSLTTALYPVFFKPFDAVPADVLTVLKNSCQKVSDKPPIVQSNCASLIRLIQSVGADNQSANTLISRLSDAKDRVKVYENSADYSWGSDLSKHQDFVQDIVPWLPDGIVLPALPHPTLVLIVTLSMGALGSVLFMLQLHLLIKNPNLPYRMSLSWHFFRPLQGMATALAIYLLVKAGQISVSRNGGAGVESVDSSDLNAFVLGFLGVVSGLLSDSAMDRLSSAGIELLKVPPAKDGNHDSLVSPPSPMHEEVQDQHKSMSDDRDSNDHLTGEGRHQTDIPQPTDGKSGSDSQRGVEPIQTLNRAVGSGKSVIDNGVSSPTG